MKKYIISLFLLLILIVVSPSIASASWWNPFSWFRKSTPAKTIQVVNPQNQLNSNQNINVNIKSKEGFGLLVPTSQCIADRGAKLYSVFWSTHNQGQVATFGKYAKLSDLPYVECSTPDKFGQLAICKGKNITAYPTWIFADGSQLQGEASIQTLAEKTGCPVLYSPEEMNERKILEQGQPDNSSDGKVKSNLNDMRVQGELYFNGHSKSYKGFCVNSSYPCHDSSTAWAAWGSIASGYWCVDSTGLSSQISQGGTPKGTSCSNVSF